MIINVACWSRNWSRFSIRLTITKIELKAMSENRSVSINCFSIYLSKIVICIYNYSITSVISVDESGINLTFKNKEKIKVKIKCNTKIARIDQRRICKLMIENQFKKSLDNHHKPNKIPVPIIIPVRVLIKMNNLICKGLNLIREPKKL